MIPRTIFPLVLFSLKHFPVTLIQGPRQVGKSFLLKLLHKKKQIKNIITLDDMTTLIQSKSSPEELIETLPKPIAIDEVQRAPELILAIKKYVDKHKKPGDFILTGSSNLFSYPETLDSLAGRMNILRLYGFSLKELYPAKTKLSFLTSIFQKKDPLKHLLETKPLKTSSIWEHVFWGSYPDVVLTKNTLFKQQWTHSFITTYIEKDLRNLTKDIVGFHKFYTYLGLMTSQQLVVSNCANDLGLDQRSVHRYLDLLQMTYQTQCLQPFYTNKIKKLVKTPKIYFQDSGFASFFFNFQNPKELISSPQKGALLETFLFNELSKLLSINPEYSLSYFRTLDGIEVDFVLSFQNQHLLIECKSQLPSSSESFKNIETFRKSFPDTKALIFYPGDQIKIIGPSILAVPFSLMCI